jgi:hypothetical protein
MKRFILICSFLISFSSTAQDLLFIGLYSKTEPGKSWLCSDMVMEKRIVKNEAEATQARLDFIAAHVKENPIVKIGRKSKIIIYEYQKPIAGFGCTIKVYGWVEAMLDSPVKIRDLINTKSDSVFKEFKTSLSEVYEWTYSSNKLIESSHTVDGIEITMLLVENENNPESKTIVMIKNPLKDKAAQLIFVVDGVQEKTAHYIGPGVSLQLNLGINKTVGLKLLLVDPKEPTLEEHIDWARQSFRESFTKKYLQNKVRLIRTQTTMGVRG